MRTAAAALVFLTACAGNPGVELDVRVRTDLIAGADFDQVRVSIDDGDARTINVVPGAPGYGNGVSIATYAGISSGTHRVRATLLLENVNIISEEVVAQVSGESQVTVVLTRDCIGMECSGALTACMGGRCVDPRCTPENQDACPADRCTMATDCPSAVQDCLTPTCLQGTCLQLDQGMCGNGNYCDHVRGCVGHDGFSDAGMLDAGPDVPMDAGPPPCEPACEGLEVCVSGVCMPAETCLTEDECGEGLICRNRHCLDPDSDPDGDGTTAATDCNETRADAYPGATELCNALDEDCDEEIDEGNPGVLCTDEGGECIAGECGCPDGQLDLDGVPDTGCECAIAPSLEGAGGSCGSPIMLGNIGDNGQMMVVGGNALSTGGDRNVWYQIRATDSADTTCDNFHFRARFTENPDDASRFEVRRGACDQRGCTDDAGYTDFSHATDFRQTIAGRLTGECPCTASGATRVRNRSVCADSSATFFIRVWRRSEVAANCNQYTLELSNGIYDSM